MKPENILYGFNEDVKIVDYGTSFSNNCFNVPYYNSPESFKNEFSGKSDAWSCGVILYLMLCGEVPFSGFNNNNIIEKI